jgi:Carboxypeptidase regulatory-like domain
MDLATRSKPILFLALALFALQSSPAQSTTSQKRPLASISGRITIKAKPAVGVTVGLRRSEPNTNSQLFAGRVTSDQDGNYRITNVPAGRYEVIVSQPGFVQTDPAPGSRMIFITEGENVEGMDFALVRGGVITGKVVDADGRPVIAQQVNVYPADAWDQRPQDRRQPIFAMRGAATDDRGIYRAFGLMPGRYKVAVGRDEDSFQTPQPPGRATYKRVFHPDIVDPAKATVVEVTEGSEATNVDIALQRPVDTYAVSGRSIDGEKNLPMPGVRVALESVGAGAYQTYSNFGTSNAQGEFVIDGVPPGKYVFSLISERGRELFLEPAAVEITDENVAGVILRLTKGASVSGVIAIENESPTALAKLRQAEVAAYVTPASGVGGRSASSTIANDGSFCVAGLPAGTAGIFLNGGPNQRGPIKNFIIARVERDGLPQPAQRIEIKDGEQVSGLRVVVTYGDATLRGSITTQNGKMPADARVHVRLIRPGDVAASIGFNQVDARGHFVIEGVPAGVYELQVNVSSSDRTMGRPIRQQVSLTAGATTEVTVALEAAQPNSP